MGDWAEWGGCDRSCGTDGTSTRVRTVHTASMYDGKQCFATQDTEACNNFACPVDCDMSDWSEASACSATCGNGETVKTRTIKVHPIYGGEACGATEESAVCVGVPCAVDCVEGPWSQWGDCHAACGPGVRRRIRFVETEPEYNGLSCGSLEHVINCDTGIECGATCEKEWGAWADCSQTCGLNGVQTRSLATAPILIHSSHLSLSYSSDTLERHGGEHCPTRQIRSCSPEINDCLRVATPVLPPAPTPPPTPVGDVPEARPVLTLRGGENLVIEAAIGCERQGGGTGCTGGGNSADPGATCIDPFEGDISSLIGVVGEINGALVGKYVLKYTCVDPVRNVAAYPMRRLVTVRDTRCPQCVLQGDESVTIEASFPFNPTDGVDCTDEATTTSELVKNTVQLGSVDVEQIGVYRLTYRVKDHNGNWNDGKCTGTHKYIRTVNVIDTLKPVIGLKLDGGRLDASQIGEAETSELTGKLNPAHAAMKEAAQASMTRRLLALDGASTNSWWTASAFAGAIGCAVVGAVLRSSRRGGAGELQTLV